MRNEGLRFGGISCIPLNAHTVSIASREHGVHYRKFREKKNLCLKIKNNKNLASGGTRELLGRVRVGDYSGFINMLLPLVYCVNGTWLDSGGV